LINPKKILIVRFSSLGDLVLTTPIYREIKNVFPNSKITLLTSFEIGSVLENNPYIDTLILHKRGETLPQLNNLIKKLRKERYDLIYDLHKSLRSIWIILNLSGYGFSKIPEVWRIKKRSWQRSLLIRYKVNFLKNSPPQRVHWLRPLQNLSKIKLKNHTELFPEEKTTLFINNFMEKHGLLSKGFIAVGASASYPLKRWPLNYFHELISGILDKGWQIVLVGGKDETESSQIEAKFSGKLINVAGKFSPLQSAELIKNASITVTNDTSIGHLSEAVSTPILVFFGPTVKEFGYTPFLKESIMLETDEVVSCRPCSPDGRGKCNNSKHLLCLKTITPKMVLKLIPLQKNFIQI